MAQLKPVESSLIPETAAMVDQNEEKSLMTISPPLVLFLLKMRQRGHLTRVTEPNGTR